MSLSVDGVWKAGVWATTAWADGVWREGDAPEPAPAATETASGGWLFLNEYAAHKQRKLARERLQKRLEEETESIPNTTDREIAEFFRHQERVEAKRTELDELAELVKGNDDLEEARQYSEEVAKAYVQA